MAWRAGNILELKSFLAIVDSVSPLLALIRSSKVILGIFLRQVMTLPSLYKVQTRGF